MRIRTIKPGFFTNDELAEVDPLGRLLFAGLWLMADRAGRLEDRPRRIKAEVLPYDTCDVDALLDQLAVRGFILRYVVEGSAYIQITGFARHQYPNQREPQSQIPEPQTDAHDTGTVPAPSSHDARSVDIGNSLGNSLGRGREHARAREDDAPAGATSLSLVKTAETPDPDEARRSDQALCEAWISATGRTPRGAERRHWVTSLAEMRADYGLSPPDCFRLVAQYRAKLGADKCPTPGQVAALYSQLTGDSHGSTTRRPDHSPAHGFDEVAAAKKRAAFLAAGVPVAPEPASPNGTHPTGTHPTG